MQQLQRRLPAWMRNAALCRLRLAVAAVAVALVAACSALPPTAGREPAPEVSRAAAAVAAFSPELASPALREAAFDQAWRIVQERFYDPAFNGTDWDAVKLRYLPQLGRAGSDVAFYALLGRMVGELKDSHTRVYNARDYRNRLDYVVTTFGLRVAEVEGEVAIAQVLPDTAAARAGLAAGMIVETVYGEPARQRLDKLRDEAPPDASPERRLRGVYARLIAARSAGPLVLEVRGAQGPLRHELQRSDREMPLAVTHRVLAGNVGYLAFNRFRPEAAAAVGRALADLGDTDGLVIDLRGNPGGNIGAMLSIAQPFFAESRQVLTRRVRNGNSAAPDGDPRPAGRAPVQVRIEAGKHPYTRPLAILIDGYSASSSELLATVLREQRGARIVGRPSCGCVVAVRGAGYRLPGGGALYVAESGFVTPAGNRMEGAGMQPDTEVSLTLSDLRSGVDRDLAVGAEWIRQRARQVARSH